ncbi:MAG: VWA domain-containing protein, partial [Opitutales bacterium]
MTPAVDWDHLLLAEPHWLWLLLLVFGLFVMQIRSRKHIAPLRIPSLINFRIAEPKRAWAGRFLPSTLRALALSSLVVALARPQLSESTQSIKSSGVDIVMAVDLSASMLALDMSEREDKPVTRLDVVKSVMKDFVTKRTHDRIGLVGFSVNPYLLSALTLDKEHLHRNLKRLRVGLTHQIGTNIGGALTEGINRVRQLEAESRIVILLTDGKDDPPPRHSPLVLAEGA